MDNVEKVLASHSRKLDLGCGIRKREGAVGVDVIANDNVDVIHDLNIYPYPFEDSSFDDILMDNSIEHLDDVVRTMEEVWRICAKWATVTIKVPYFRSHYAIDPTHKQYFVGHSFNYFDPDEEFHKYYRYSEIASFSIQKVVYDQEFKYRGIYRLWLTIPRWIANRHSLRYERYLGPLFPMNSIAFYLTVNK
jgi:SAM-dependent methyltransferase